MLPLTERDAECGFMQPSPCLIHVTLMHYHLALGCWVHDIENMYTLYTVRTLIIVLDIFLPQSKKLWHLPLPPYPLIHRHRSAGLRSSPRHANVKHATPRNASGSIFVESVHGRTREYIAEHLSWATRRVTTV